jgi:GAF domain-containing protein
MNVKETPLAALVHNIAEAPTGEAVVSLVRAYARRIIDCNGVTFVLRDGEYCYYAEEDAIGPLWKGRRFPLSTCISGWVMQHGQPAVIEDIYADERIPADAYRPTFVKSLAMVPVRRPEPLAAIGAYWARPHLATPEQLTSLRVIADAVGASMERLPAPWWSRELRERELVWSKRGEIRCRAHAPIPGGSRWDEEGWAPVPPGRGAPRRPYRCPECA